MDKVAVVYNAHSGPPTQSSERPLEDRLRELFACRGVAVALRAFDPSTVRKDVRELLAEQPAALMVAGGDGTVRSVAPQLVETGVPLGVLPTGTMNVLAHDLGIPDEIEPALDTLLASPVRMIDTAWVNGQLFLCSSALAVMPHLGRLRERDRASVGWSRPRLWVQALRVWRRYPRARLRLVVDGHEHDVRTRAMVVSNNLLSVRQGRLPGRDRIDAGLLGVYVTRDKNPSDLLVIAAMLLNGRWPTKERLHTFQGRSVQVFSSHLDLTSVMSDGELSQLTMPLRYDITPRALAVLSPLENS